MTGEIRNFSPEELLAAQLIHYWAYDCRILSAWVPYPPKSAPNPPQLSERRPDCPLRVSL